MSQAKRKIRNIHVSRVNVYDWGLASLATVAKDASGQQIQNDETITYLA